MCFFGPNTISGLPNYAQVLEQYPSEADPSKLLLQVQDQVYSFVEDPESIGPDYSFMCLCMFN